MMAVKKPSTVSARVRYGTESIAVEVSFSQRKRLTITVNPDQTVLIKAPIAEPIVRVLEFVHRRAPWIKKQRQYFEQFKPLPLVRQYISGETFLYLGRQYRLKVMQDVNESVKLLGRYLTVSTADRQDRDRIRGLVDQWYMDHAKVLLKARYDKCLVSATQLNIEQPEIRVRHMQRSWGTCSAKGWIHLNRELVKTPVYCIDYVIMHELCHLRHRDHSKAFYRLLSRCMPDWRQRKERLDRYVI